MSPECLFSFSPELGHLLSPSPGLESHCHSRTLLVVYDGVRCYLGLLKMAKVAHQCETAWALGSFLWRVEVCQGVHDAPFSLELWPGNLGSQNSTARTTPHTNHKIESGLRNRGKSCAKNTRITCCIIYWFNKIYTSSLSSAYVSAKCRVLRPPRDAPSYDVAHGFWATLVAHEASVKLDFWMATVWSLLSWDERPNGHRRCFSNPLSEPWLFWNQVAWRSHAASRSPTWVRGHPWSVRTAVLRMTIPQCSFCSERSPPKKIQNLSLVG